MMEILLSLLFLLIAAALGKRVLSLSRASNCFESFWEELPFAVATGIGVIAYIALLLGLIGLFYRLPFLIMLLGLVLLLHRDIIAILGQCWSLIRRAKKPHLGGLSWVLLIALALHICLGFLAALSPPIGSDAQAYHLAVPKLYLKYHRFIYVPYIGANYPFTMEMIYSIGMALWSDVLSRLIQVWISLMLLSGMYFLCKRLNLKAPFLYASVLFYCLPVVTHRVGDADTDIGVTFFMFLAIYALLCWYRSLKKGWLIAFAITSGFAGSIKLIGFFPLLVFPLALFAKLLSTSSEDRRSLLRIAPAVVVISALLGSPWYIKSYVVTGNPFMPWFYGIFGGKDWSATLAENLKMYLANWGTGRSLKSFVLSPWNITMHPGMFDFQRILPTFLAIIPCLLFFRKVDRSVKLILIYFALFYVFWFFSFAQSIRYLLPILPWLAIVASYTIRKSEEHNKLLSQGFAILLILASVSNLLVSFYQARLIFPVVMGIESREKFLSRSLEFYPVYRYAEDNLPENSKLLLYVNMGYYCNLEYVNGVPMNQAYIRYDECDSLQDLLEELSSKNITHVLTHDHTLYRSSSARYYPEVVVLVRYFVAMYGKLLYENGGVRLYSLRPMQSPAAT